MAAFEVRGDVIYSVYWYFDIIYKAFAEPHYMPLGSFYTRRKH